MKWIDILNKIANGEEVPKRVKFDDKIYFYNPEWKDYSDEEKSHGLIVDVMCNTYQIVHMLNDEIEIIEEDKKIEKIIINSQGNIEKKFIDGSRIVLPCVGEEVLHIAYKVNELIDEVNKLKEK